MKSLILTIALFVGFSAPAFADAVLTSINTKSPDYVIIKNTGSSEINLGGYKLVEDDASWTIPGGTKLAAGNSLKVYCFSKKKAAAEGRAFAKSQSGKSGVLVSIEFGISSGEKIELKSKFGKTVSVIRG
ncbi:MAG: lamin tail domain-containing protein [Verrucomicrobiota bacterium]|nr:lamin tail domain-containing protein [Verrucomicrobiota bacterium]